MSLKTIELGFFLCVIWCSFSAGVFPHHTPLAASASGQPGESSPPEVARAFPGVSGQGALTFRVLYGRGHLPDPARAALESAHGGFAVDRRPGQGEIYFALPGAGILRIASDLEKVEMVGTPAEMRETNLHNTTIWYGDSGQPYLSFPADGAGQVFTTDLEGRLVNKLSAPGPEDSFSVARVSEYFTAGGKFAPTDVEHLEELLYITTGYSELDFVLTAKLTGSTPPGVAWSHLAFGGKGTAPGQFGTGHGITVPPGDRVLEVSDRPNAEIDRFSEDGDYLQTLELPPGSFPCDIDYERELAVVACLHGPDRNKGAPLYILREGKVVSTINPKEDLGLEGFQHLHNAVLRNVGDRWYIIVQAWNPGGFAILEQTGQGEQETR